ncbi:MAG: hypothetical protein LBV43_03910 [Prevotella sp.]|nr:hypothetical protein [Prevotella sp.]
MDYPFYFFGSGVRKFYMDSGDRDTTYIKFITKPSIEQVQKILEIAPKTARREGSKGDENLKKYGIETPVLHLFSELGIRTIIGNEYGNGLFGNDACKAFSADIDEWLMRVHDLCPIEAVIRASYKEDETHSDWHMYSINNADALLEKWFNEPKEVYENEEYDFSEMMDELVTSLKAYKRKPKYSFEQIMAGSEDNDGLMSYEEANDFEIDKKASASTSYYDLTNNKLVPLISTALTLAIRQFRQLVEEGEADEENISVELDDTMKFYLGEDECEGKPFFKFKLGPVYKKSMELQKKMEKAGGTSYRQAVSNLFEDAHVDESEYSDLSLTLWVPEVGGDPYIES